MAREISRTEFLKLGGVAAAASLVGGCDLLSTTPDGGGGRQAGSANDRQAPALAERVKSGDLPALEKRLPKQPLVITPVERTGVYGGTWRTAILEEETTWLHMTVNHDHLVAWDPEWKKIVPNIAASFNIADDGRQFIFDLRNGMKWSDGHAFTADDITFWYDAMFRNETLNPVVHSDLQTRGDPVVVKKLDDHQVSFVFTHPNGTFLQELAAHVAPFPIVPQHYLEQFHKDFNPNVDELVEDANVPDWVELFLQKADVFNNPKLPVLYGWIATTSISDGTRMLYERNPYYFKVDPDGRQLPYIDRISYDRFTSEESMVLRAASGEIDMHARAPLNTPRNKPVLARDAADRGYRLSPMRMSDMNTIGICLNLTHDDPVKREIFQNRNFRIGLSYAINREEIIDVVFQRQGKPWQIAPVPDAPYSDSGEMGTQYTEYSLEKANSYLDRAGYSARDGKGMRLGPDGKPISIAVLTQTRYFEMVDTLELIRPTWADVGVDLVINNIDGALYETRFAANDFDCVVDIGELGYLDAILDPRWYFAYNEGSRFSLAWANWFIGSGTPREEPPEAMKRQMEIYVNQVQEETDLQEQIAGMREIVEIAKEEFWAIGICLPGEPYLVVKNNFHNVPENMWLSWKWPTPGPTQISQYFMEPE
jgi:peptide/nickel transport system substrate-binding protein